jgi:hypothetical protein
MVASSGLSASPRSCFASSAARRPGPVSGAPSAARSVRRKTPRATGGALGLGQHGGRAVALGHARACVGQIGRQGATAHPGRPTSPVAQPPGPAAHRPPRRGRAGQRRRGDIEKVALGGGGQQRRHRSATWSGRLTWRGCGGRIKRSRTAVAGWGLACPEAGRASDPRHLRCLERVGHRG